MDYLKYIKAELLILVPVLYIIGLGLKKSKLADKWIPLALGITGIILSAVWVVATSPIATMQDAAAALFTALTQGILATGASVYASQLHIQAHKEE
ncbi:MAG: hypothetical protein E7448_08470 [Ruminococcaceae bacterium]|nr:hypothetical protein [Oscillospiraceae bacterium]